MKTKSKVIVFFMMVLFVVSGCSNSKTAEEAIRKNTEWQDVFSIVQTDNDFALAFMEETEGLIEVGLVVNGKNGWETSDTTGGLGIHDPSGGFAGMSGPLYINDDDFLVLSWGLIVDEEIEKIEVVNDKEKEVHIIESNYGTKVYYIVDANMEDISAEYQLVALSNDGMVLYERP
ncbi:hypothetical protein B0H99_107144 [Planomicrobium soli]|uniref:Uncharacterized protein n=1 Tax=Planomicrobium soli TaxID=1176648 RepID=A0A2P8GQS4_9BACL|nr:hypothetical protein [Planomicrobium soli]PSL36323.1 hypothetical protein B0H99_107144 [Planomicrobium soli]